MFSKSLKKSKQKFHWKYWGFGIRKFGCSMTWARYLFFWCHKHIIYRWLLIRLFLQYFDTTNLWNLMFNAYIHSIYIRIGKQNQFHEKIRWFIVSKFVKLSDELIICLEFSQNVKRILPMFWAISRCFRTKKNERKTSYIFKDNWNLISNLKIATFEIPSASLTKNKIPVVILLMM